MSSIKLSEEKYCFFNRFSDKGRLENPRFFQRLGNFPIVGLNVLEIGCGTGSLAIYMAQHGAKKVVALDINSENIQYANMKLEREYPQYKNIVEYRNIPIQMLDENENFDCIVSKDVFEHLHPFAENFEQIVSRMLPGDRLLAGFSPLYQSPFGGHGLTRFPYDHLFLPEKHVIARGNRRYKHNHTNIHDFGINKLKITDYLQAIHRSGLKIIFLEFNQSSKFRNLDPV